MLSRRTFLATAASAVLPGGQPSGLKIGVMDGVLRQSGKPESVGLAKQLGFEGLQATLGRPDRGGRLPLEDAELQWRFTAESRKHGLPINSTYIDVLHVNCLKDDPLARTWVLKGIEITSRLKAEILMTVFFGKCSLNGRQEMEKVAAVFRELAPEAEKAGVILGFENLLNADDNLWVMDRVASRAFRIYYDTGNTTNLVGVDAPAEIRRLGKDRICQFHFKDKGYLGEGKVDYRAVLQAVGEIGFEGFANLETSAPSGSMENDLRRNLGYLRQLMGA